jgi:NAD(P)-dependent dehydrogenase (short-subunit alcohol dehydrogenase family)
VGDGNLEGKVVLVTGGSRGIGRAIVLGAARQGARIVFCARHIGEAGQTVPQEAGGNSGGGRIVAVRADVSQEQDVETLFQAAHNAFGRVDVVVNNAGISRARLLVALPESDWDSTIAVNLTGAFLVSKWAIKTFLTQVEGGRIISIGSVTQNGAPSNSAYAASKGGLIGLTRAIAREYGQYGIHANLIVGGYVKTDIIQDMPESLLDLLKEICPQKREASADEVAAVVLHLAANPFLPLNGESIYVSGGLVDPPPYAPR